MKHKFRKLIIVLFLVWFLMNCFINRNQLTSSQREAICPGEYSYGLVQEAAKHRI